MEGAAITLGRLTAQISQQRLVITLLTKQVEGLLNEQSQIKDSAVARTETPVEQSVSSQDDSAPASSFPNDNGPLSPIQSESAESHKTSETDKGAEI